MPRLLHSSQRVFPIRITAWLIGANQLTSFGNVLQALLPDSEAQG